MTPRPLLAMGLLALVSLSVACSNDNDDEVSVIKLGADGPGTCLAFDDTVGEEVTKLPVVPCEEEHSHEIFAVKVTSTSVYPGFDALEAEAQAQCLAAFHDYIGISAFDSELFYSWLVPTLTSWDRSNDREIICLVGEDNDAPLVGSLRGVAR